MSSRLVSSCYIIASFCLYILSFHYDIYVNLNYNYFIVRLSDSILAFHKYGVQGRSLRNGEVTQEIIDKSRTYRLLGSDKYVISVPTFSNVLYNIFVNLIILTKMQY